MHDNNDVNHMYECNLLHDILNPSKRVKITNDNHSPNLYVCINTRKGKANLKKF